MQYQLSAQPLRLHGSRHGAEQRISCQQGTIWLTKQGDHHDYFVQAGETLDIGGDAVIISALGQRAVAEVCLQRR